MATETDYLFISARVRCLENDLLSADVLRRLTEAGDSAAFFSVLEEYGYPLMRNEINGKIGAEESFDAAWQTALQTVAQDVPDGAVVDFFRYGADCNNLKSALKCAALGRDAAELLQDGSVSAACATEAVEKEDFSAYPEQLAQGAAAALDAYRRTGDGRQIDLILDRACFAQMAQAAQGEPFLQELLARRADTTNLLTALRLARREGATARRLFPEAALPGGVLPVAELAAAVEGGPEQVAEFIARSPYAALCALGDVATLPFQTLSRGAEDLCLSFAEEAKWVPFGAPVVACYLLAKETEVKNLRMILAGIRAGVPAAEMQGRLRRLCC